MRKYIAFSELPEMEREIGKRVREARKKFRISQTRLAPVLGLTRDQLNNIELGRVALRIAPGWSLCAELDLNPLWLRLGSPEEQHGFVDLSGSDNFFGDVLFSLVMDDFRQEEPVESWPGYREFRRFALKPQPAPAAASPALLAKWLSKVVPEQRADFLKRIDKAARDFVREQKENVIQSLTSRSASANIASMKLQKVSLWPRLRDRIRKVVRERGMKSMLARDIGVSRQAINALLSARRKKPYVPSAEYTLRLLEWVKAAEAKQKKRIGSAETQPALKTRKRKSKYEKPSSDPKKK